MAPCTGRFEAHQLGALVGGRTVHGQGETSHRIEHLGDQVDPVLGDGGAHGLAPGEVQGVVVDLGGREGRPRLLSWPWQGMAPPRGSFDGRIAGGSRAGDGEEEKEDSAAQPGGSNVT